MESGWYRGLCPSLLGRTFFTLAASHAGGITAKAGGSLLTASLSGNSTYTAPAVTELKRSGNEVAWRKDASRDRVGAKRKRGCMAKGCQP
ncbi:MAG: hypothetical protein NC300_07960 [Bacteroidales bacterium]|nr:hypothetical protein [Clostridium sp.]MCM1204065.1 hypothetical protein [Bacteroidales bacterium]